MANLILPQTLAAWQKPAQPQVITEKTIFDYMDGAGELYIGYQFDHLDVYEYEAPDTEGILVEIYWMGHPDEAFGLLSQDWGGEAVSFFTPPVDEPQATAPAVHALYGMGLLRLWAETVYARIMAYRETEASKKAVFAIAQAICAGRSASSQPAFLRRIPATRPGGWKIDSAHVCYFHSMAVLNSKYYISHQNILNLNRETQAAMARFERVENETNKQRIHHLALTYPTPEQAREGVLKFGKAYLPDQNIEAIREQHGYVFQIEDGFLGLRLDGPDAVLVFESPTQETALSFLEYKPPKETNASSPPSSEEKTI